MAEKEKQQGSEGYKSQNSNPREYIYGNYGSLFIFSAFHEQTKSAALHIDANKRTTFSDQ